MTASEIANFPFTAAGISEFRHPLGWHRNWPVVYTLNGGTSVYVGETVNAVARLRQHRESDEKREKLTTARVVVDEKFNKSACLDLESFLIKLFSGEGRYEVLNRNDGIVDADYYDRHRYRKEFVEIFERLRDEGLFNTSIREIENSDLYKLSPFKSLNEDQAVATENILEGLLKDLDSHVEGTAVIQGDPGTGKTIVAVFLMKLLQDIRDWDPQDEPTHDSIFSDLFVPEHAALLRDFRAALVIPQQSLRETIRSVFAKTSGLSREMVLSPFDVGASKTRFDLLIVDETHRLGRRVNQSSGVLNARFRDINVSLYGNDDPTRTQLDWVITQSRNRILLLDSAQSVRPGDLTESTLGELTGAARDDHRHFPLRSQMRVQGGFDYVDHIRGILDGTATEARSFGDYDFRMFENLNDLHSAIKARDEEHGLARLVAGYAWEWKSKKNPIQVDIEVDGVALRWNSKDKDWIASARSVDEVGSIHTVQGYDLNYAGVIIGRDLAFDPATGGTQVDRRQYFDSKGKENSPKYGVSVTDADLLRYIRNVYGVLLTRGMLGTYLYVCDPQLRDRFRSLIK